LQVDFIDVGQGDAALIACDGEYMLIDGGSSKASSVIYTILKNRGIKHIDYMIATHPDADHIGGLSGALNYATVDTCYCSVTQHDTKTFRSLLKYLVRQKAELTVPEAGDVFELGTAKVTVLGPLSEPDESNNSSIVVRLEYGDTSFLFMGDAETEEENEILKNNKDLKSDVIKIGHHGSKSSSSKSFLNAVKPEYAVISVGKNNTYGHPTQTVLDRLTSLKTTVYRTDLQGDITMISDGKEITVSTEKNVSPSEVNKKAETVAAPNTDTGVTYVLNNNTKKFHYPHCGSVSDMSPKNRQDVNMSRDEIISRGYVPCKKCKP
jgi:competence protein ComEC